jgi:hypothetical protein
MKQLHGYVIAVASIGIVASVSQASAQERCRDAAIHKCMLKIVTEYPCTGGDDQDSARIAAYKSCMSGAGYKP